MAMACRVDPVCVCVCMQDELEGMLAQQQTLAMKLEEDLARAEASCQDLEGDLQVRQEGGRE
jgi:hypothetical protein